MNTHLSSLSAASQNLNSASDLLSQQITAFETALNSLKLGVAAWVDVRREPCEDDPSGDGDYYVKLVYGKRKGRWALLLAQGHLDVDNPEITFLADAPREERVAAAEKLPALIRALEAKAQEMEKRIAKSAATLKSLVERVAQ